jgi:hypothetical protein
LNNNSELSFNKFSFFEIVENVLYSIEMLSIYISEYSEVVHKLEEIIMKKGSGIPTPYWMAPEMIQEVGYDCKVNSFV